ncbi:MAG: polysaccharide biosynthesis tyrosine autokinase [Ignavibacteria bacterium]|nr:polysaccharide biosynthesis tyrosine autokinase [Ignavibacteria bacterium]
MNKTEKYFIEHQPKSLRENIDLIRTNIFPVFIIALSSLVFSVIYAYNAVNIYKATALMKISKPTGNILEAPLMPTFTDIQFDRFLSNEIEILKSTALRRRVAAALIDSFKTSNNPQDFYLLLDSDNRKSKNSLPKVNKIESLVSELKSVDIEAKRGLDFVEITVLSPSKTEAALIANTYANMYKTMNLELSRNQLTNVRQFLNQQRDDKQKELSQAEESLKSFQEHGGIVSLEQQANALISQLSSLEAKRDAAKIDLSSSDKVLQKYRQELKDRAPYVSAYLDKVSSEEFMKNVQQELTTLEVNKELLSLNSAQLTAEESKTLAEYETKIKRINDLVKQKKTEILKSNVLAATPEELRDLTQKILSEDLRLQSAKISIDVMNSIISKYEQKFNLLPKSSIEFARLQRKREALEKLFVLVEQKLQESLINEQSQPGNVLLLDKAEVPNNPSKPNRMLIIVVGFFLGLLIAFGYVFLKNYFDNTVKTPDDIQKLNANVLSWIPQIEGLLATGSSEFEFIVARKPDSIPAESFRALRTRVQFSRVDTEALKTVLITSSAPSEGKTIICTNLAGSFALSNKKTLILDCDLRKPRIHSFFKTNRYPGLVDYLFDQVPFDDIVRTSEIPDLYYITAGTIPPNPSEILESQKMKDFINSLRDKYDYILLDSPPIIAVTDSEILARVADATALVVSANTTEVELLMRSLEIIRQDNINFIGTILNNFVYRSSYGSYYKYYYYYTRPRKTDRTKLPPKMDA